MPTTDPRDLPAAIPAPSRVEAVALEEAARYLRRVGAQVGTLMLVEPRPDAQVMMETLRGGSLSCAAFCEQLLELGAARRRGPAESPSP